MVICRSDLRHLRIRRIIGLATRTLLQCNGSNAPFVKQLKQSLDIDFVAHLRRRFRAYPDTGPAADARIVVIAENPRIVAIAVIQGHGRAILDTCRAADAMVLVQAGAVEQKHGCQQHQFAAKHMDKRHVVSQKSDGAQGPVGEEIAG